MTENPDRPPNNRLKKEAIPPGMAPLFITAGPKREAVPYETASTNTNL